MAIFSHRIDAAHGNRDYAPATALDRRAFGYFSLALMASLVPLSMMLPSIALAISGGVLLAAGLLMAAVLWWRGTSTDHRVGGWDIAGLIVFLGFAACIAGGPASKLLV